MWSIATTVVQVRIKIQLNSVLYLKTLIRKDLASSAAAKESEDTPEGKATGEDEDTFSSKAQIMNLMTTDVRTLSWFRDSVGAALMFT